jgi:hypothetical protein
MPELPTISNLGQALPENTGICVINLDRRSDRWEAFQKEMLPQLLPREVIRISAIEGIAIAGFGDAPYFRGRKRDRTWAARAGCTLSHRAALLHALDVGWSHVLVLEDDIHMPIPPKSTMLSELREKISIHAPDVCYFGFTDPVPPFKQMASLGPEHKLHQVFGCNTAHAYLVSKKAISHLVSMLPEPQNIWRWLMRYRAVDRFYYRHLSPALRVMAVSPTIIDQQPGFSDIIGRSVVAYSETHYTAIESRHPNEQQYARETAKQKNNFARLDKVDQIRGLWKSLRGF